MLYNSICVYKFICESVTILPIIELRLLQIFFGPKIANDYFIQICKIVVNPIVNI